MSGCRPLTPRDLRALSARLGPRDRAMLYTGCATGLRISELLSLRREEVERPDGIHRRLWLDASRLKGKHKGRVVYLDRKSVRAIRAWLKIAPAKSPWLFPSAKGGAITRIQAHRIITSAAEAARLPPGVGTHSMRKTFAEHADKAFGHDTAMVQTLIGHEDPRTTLRYLNRGSEFEMWKRLHSRAGRA